MKKIKSLSPVAPVDPDRAYDQLQAQLSLTVSPTDDQPRVTCAVTFARARVLSDGTVDVGRPICVINSHDLSADGPAQRGFGEAIVEVLSELAMELGL